MPAEVRDQMSWRTGDGSVTLTATRVDPTPFNRPGWLVGSDLFVEGLGWVGHESNYSADVIVALDEPVMDPEPELVSLAATELSLPEGGTGLPGFVDSERRR